MKEDKRTINGVKQRKQVYTHSKTLFNHRPRKIAVKKTRKTQKEISILQEKGKDSKKIYTCPKINKKEMPKKKEPKVKRKITKAQTIPDTRLTEPKKRSLLRRVMLQMKYNRGAFDYIEKEYNDLSTEELEEYRNSNKRIDRRYYKEVQEYEDAYDDVTVRKGWMTFKIGLATIMLCTSIGLYNHVIQDIHDHAPQEAIVITLQDATEEQIAQARSEMSSLKISSEYNFKNLTSDEQIDATLRLPIVESKIPEGRFKNAIISFKDQELLEAIVEEAYGEEYQSFSEEKKADLNKLAYELLSEEQKESVRDPKALAELLAKQEAERAERERMQAEVEARLNGRNENSQDEMELE